MEELPILNIIGGALFFFAKIVFVLASAILVFKKRGTAAIVMLLGSISVLIGDALGLFLIVNAGKNGAEEVVKFTGVNSIIQATTFFIFSLGLLFYILSHKKQTTSLQ